jgi:hypothetical protein
VSKNWHPSIRTRRCWMIIFTGILSAGKRCFAITILCERWHIVLMAGHSISITRRIDWK